MVVPTITRTSMVLRLLCGLWIVGAVMGAGVQQRSPWVILPLGLAYTVLFVAGKWDAWQLAIETSGWRALPLGLLTTLPIQCAIVAFFYGIGLVFSALSTRGVDIRPTTEGDWRFAGLVLGVGGALAIAANALESRATPEEDLFREFLEKRSEDDPRP